jgi:hydroxyacylglutathione hydrolase
MLIERIWADNTGRNFHYLVACEHTGEAVAIDPLKWEAVLSRARELHWNITQIFNTHEHGDHTGGNAALVAHTRAPVLAHADAAQRIGGVDFGLNGGDEVRVGTSVRLRCLDTPGHTRAHLCLYAEAKDGQAPALFSGDTMFNAGVGNCINGGDPELLYLSFTDCIAKLPDATRVYPGHEYLERNLGFALDREPSNQAARKLAQRMSSAGPALSGARAPVLSLGEEKQLNVFLRLEQPEISAVLQRGGIELGASPKPRDVFLALRELRNRW